MPYRKAGLASGECYHLYPRGNNFERIFANREDYLRFLSLIRRYLTSPGVVRVLAYCLMPNHYHLFVRLRADNLSEQMQALSVSYAKGFNLKYGRAGRLFQAPFKAIHVTKDVYVSALVAYIHRNPVDAGLVKLPQDWEYSSFRDYSGLRKGTLIDRSESEGMHREATRLTWSFGEKEKALLVGLTAEEP